MPDDAYDPAEVRVLEGLTSPMLYIWQAPGAQEAAT